MRLTESQLRKIIKHSILSEEVDEPSAKTNFKHVHGLWEKMDPKKREVWLKKSKDWGVTPDKRLTKEDKEAMRAHDIYRYAKQLGWWDDKKNQERKDQTNFEAAIKGRIQLAAWHDQWVGKKTTKKKRGVKGKSWTKTRSDVKRVQTAILDKLNLDKNSIEARKLLGASRKSPTAVDGYWGEKTNGIWKKATGGKSIPDTVEKALSMLNTGDVLKKVTTTLSNIGQDFFGFTGKE